jgi:diguanylate cyclase (GGDEF)-like protein
MPASPELSTHVEVGLVFVSVAVAILGSYAALDLTGRSADATGLTRRLLIAAGGVMMGLGIWSMHFIGMLALRMDMRVSYDYPLVVLSLLVAVAGASMSLAVVTRPHVSRRGTVIAGLFMGLATAAMHYIGMESMQMAAVIHWRVLLVLASIAVGVLASLAALWILVRISLSSAGFSFARRAAAAVLLGFGVAGLHYTAMAASTFAPALSATSAHSGLSTDALVVVLVLGAAAMLGALIYGSAFDQRRAALAFDLMTAANLARELCRVGDTGARICQAVRDIASSDHALLAQTDESGARRITASSAASGDSDELAADILESQSDTGSQRVPAEVLSALSGPGEISPGLHRLREGATVLYEPLTIAGREIGVLALVWHGSLSRLPDRTATLVKMLAAEGAVAVDRDSLIDKLERLSRLDPLTGLLNRRVFSEELDREIAAATRHRRPLSLVLLDLDFFKRYNDAHGHQAGDRLLATAANAWSALLREIDLVARYGGEEFVVILPDCGLDDAVATADRLREATPGGATCSAGVATLEAGDSTDELVGRADRALYEAKASGRNRTCAGRSAAVTDTRGPTYAGHSEPIVATP